MHRYVEDPASGAGNCFCGWARDTRLHWHVFRPRRDHEEMCVCASYDRNAPQHQEEPMP